MAGVLPPVRQTGQQRDAVLAPVNFARVVLIGVQGQFEVIRRQELLKQQQQQQQQVREWQGQIIVLVYTKPVNTSESDPRSYK